MQRYANRSGHSGVASYEIGIESITIAFVDGSRYSYTYESTGAEFVEEMKSLAEDGYGLNTFINQFVGKRFAHKLQ